MPSFTLSLNRPAHRPSNPPTPPTPPSRPSPPRHFLPIPSPVPQLAPPSAMPAPYAPDPRLSDAASSSSSASDPPPALPAHLKALNLSSLTPAPSRPYPRALSLSPISSTSTAAAADDPLIRFSAASSSSASPTSTSTTLSSSSTLRDLIRPARPASTPAPPLAKSASARTLEIPRGRLECLPRPPRPETPRQLPRPRVFIRPSSSGKSTNDTDFERFVMPDRDADTSSSDVTRPSSEQRPSGWDNNPEKTVTQLLEEEDDFYFSDEESAAGVRDIPRSAIKKDPFSSVPGSDAISSKVQRVLSNLRSISFQNPAVEDMDTAWGQAGPEHLSFCKKSAASNNTVNTNSSRWRRPRGRISSKNGVQEFECYSEADAASMLSYGSGPHDKQRERGYNSRDAMRGLHGTGGRYKKSLWNSGSRKDRSPAVAAHFLVGNNGHGYLAAATTLNEPLHSVKAVVPADTDTQERRRGSVDKYVEFIHASAQRESKNKMLSKNFTGRVINRAQGLFRRKWKI